MHNYASKLRSVFVVGFLLTVALALTSYIDSSFLGLYVSIKTVGILFSLGSVVAIIFLSCLPTLLKRIGVRGVFHAAGLSYLLAVLGMLHTANPILFGSLFIIYIASGYGIYFVIDMLIESLSQNKSTGMTRGLYLAIYNLAYLLGPLLAGMMLKNASFGLVYLTSGVFVIIMMLVFIRDLETIDVRPTHPGLSFSKSLKRLFKSKNLFNVYIVSLMLAFFFSWMAIYTPIYLRTFAHFSWQQIGIMFALMHIPYIILEAPLGKIADKIKYEKEMMTLGLIIIGLSTMVLGTIGDASFWIWTIGLAATRVGASFVQVGSESYFFKKVNIEDSYMIALFRNATPLAYILGPVTGTIVLAFTNYNNLFIVLGVVMFCIIFFSMRLRNIR